MKKNIFFLLIIILFQWGCQKKENIAKVQNKTPDTLVITEKCVVFSSPTIQQIEKLKKEMGEEDFYTGADDYAYYANEASQFLDQKKLKYFTINDKKVIIFRSKIGDFKIDRDTVKDFWNTYLFDPKKFPKKVDEIEMEKEYDDYFGKDKIVSSQEK